MRTMHLFAGIGGGLLADLILGHQPVVAVEWEPYACKVLRERAADGWFPGLHVWEGDVRLFDPSEYTDRVQQIADGFYTKNGPCCAGCDWWTSFNSAVGECRKSAPVSGDQRFSMVGIQWASVAAGAGHIATPREHHCGDFKDDFDWSSLSVRYLALIGRDAKGCVLNLACKESRK